MRTWSAIASTARAGLADETARLRRIRGLPDNVDALVDECISRAPFEKQGSQLGLDAGGDTGRRSIQRHKDDRALSRAFLPQPMHGRELVGDGPAIRAVGDRIEACPWRVLVGVAGKHHGECPVTVVETTERRFPEPSGRRLHETPERRQQKSIRLRALGKRLRQPPLGHELSGPRRCRTSRPRPAGRKFGESRESHGHATMDAREDAGLVRIVVDQRAVGRQPTIRDDNCPLPIRHRDDERHRATPPLDHECRGPERAATKYPRRSNVDHLAGSRESHA
jgi:hypothetical protein